MNSFAKKLVNLIYPKDLTCISCGKELNDSEREFALCSECKSKLVEKPDDIIIGDNFKVASCFQYDKVSRNLVLGYKDNDKPYICEYIAKFMANKYIDNNMQADGIVFVPSNKKKIRKRGYDALKYVAEFMSAELGIPIIDGLKKKKGGIDLTKVAMEDRLMQVKDSFFVDDNSNLIKKNILLIDDVITTGATITECSKALKKAGINKLIVITFSRAGK
jgi:competence protein ComFC